MLNSNRAYYLFIDSSLRSTGTNSDFTFECVQNNHILSKGTVAVSSLTLTNAIYQVNTTNNVLNWTVTRTGPTTSNHTITIPEGNYSISELTSAIQQRMNVQTSAANTSIPIPLYSPITNKLSWRKYEPSGTPDTGQLPNEVSASYTLLSTSTIKNVLGFDTDFTFINVHNESPNMINLRPIDYFYLTSPNINSSSFAPNIGGNQILARIRILTSRNNTQFADVDNIMENLINCSTIPTQWRFTLFDKFGQKVNLQIPFSFTLRIFPE